jgi:hypothetical protein
MTKTISAYNAAREYYETGAQDARKPFIGLTGSKYMHDLKIIKNLTAIPWTRFSHELAHNMSLPEPVSRDLANATDSIPMAHFTERLMRNMVAAAPASFTM